MKSVIIDMSPVMYSCLISTNSEAKRNGAVLVDGTVPFTYRDQLMFKILEEVSNRAKQFPDSELILAMDTPGKNGYWRKQEYKRYKYGRARGRDESDIDWRAAFEVFNEVKSILKSSSRHKVLEVEAAEADDIAFVLSKYFNELNPKQEVTLITLDNDWEHCLKWNNVKLLKTRKTQRKSDIYVSLSEDDINVKRLQHSIQGDKGDGFLHIKSWTQFSDAFLEEYPRFKGRELEMYEHHHDIEDKFAAKHNYAKGMDAYKHPRFGYKSWIKKKQPLEALLKEHPIYKENFIRNEQMCLPDYVPDNYRQSIIEDYHNALSTPDYFKLQKFFQQNNLFELLGSVTFF